MKLSSAVAVVVAIAGLAVSAPVYAASTNINVPAHAMFSKSKVVKLSVRNDSGAPIELKVGDQVMPLDPGKTVALKVPVGTRVVLNNSIPKHEAGEVIAEASTAVADSTFAIK